MDEPEMQGGFDPLLADNVALLHEVMGNSYDFIVRELVLPGGCRVALFYLDGMIDKRQLEDNVITALHNPILLKSEVTVSLLLTGVIEAGEVKRILDAGDAVDEVLSGGVLLLLNGARDGLVVSIPGGEVRNVEDSKTQPVIRGPQEAFVETLRTNTALVRRRVKDARIRIRAVTVGAKTKTDVAIMYLQVVADERIVDRIVERLKASKLDKVFDGQYLEEVLHGHKQRTIFPMFYNTDRPDTIAAGIVEGRIAIFIDGTPFVLIVPSLFVDFMQSAEDYYQPYLYSNLIRMVRYLSLFICMLAPAIYIALTTFHQDMIPTVLLLSLAAQREGIPFPAFVEALIMEITFEILREAGLRMPRTIGQAVSIMGTIVIGQAAVEASIVSPVMVIVVAITAISSFVIPAYSMSIPIRILRFAFMGLSALFGSYGLVVGFIILILHLAGLSSFGEAYLRPFAPFSRRMQEDAILRYSYGSRSAGKGGGNAT